MADDDDDEGSLFGAYEKGHWIWDEIIDGLQFISDLPPPVVEAFVMPIKALTGTVEFKDEIDFAEQLRFRRRYARKLKLGHADIIVLQDVKDIAIFTAPLAVQSASLINVLHLPTTERFLRALIFNCQYYLQVSDIMADRVIETEKKVRTPCCDILENELRANLCDLRVLVAKEYCNMLLGVAELRKYHHMGQNKKRRSLSDKDARLIETLLRMSVQIVWLALGRKSFHQIELEVNRIFKSEIFNNVEHTLRTNYIAKMTKEEKHVLLGSCVRHDKKLNTRSPLLNEVFCDRPVDYRMVGLGAVKYDVMTPRLLYMEQAVSLSEETMVKAGVTVGILGIPRATFDTMLRPIPTTSTAKGSASSVRASAVMSVVTNSSIREKKSSVVGKLYPDIVLPTQSSSEDFFPGDFPDESDKVRACNEVQRRRWQNRLKRMLNPAFRRRSSRYT